MTENNFDIPRIEQLDKEIASIKESLKHLEADGLADFLSELNDLFSKYNIEASLRINHEADPCASIQIGAINSCLSVKHTYYNDFNPITVASLISLQQKHNLRKETEKKQKQGQLVELLEQQNNLLKIMYNNIDS